MSSFAKPAQPSDPVGFVYVFAVLSYTEPPNVPEKTTGGPSCTAGPPGPSGPPVVSGGSGSLT